MLMLVCGSATEGQSVAASARRQLAGGKIARFLESLGFGAPKSLLKCRLRCLPLWSQPPKRRLACRGQRPAPFSTIAAGGIDHETLLPDKSQGSRCGGLIDPHCIGKISRSQVRNKLQHLQRRVLRGMEVAVSEDLLVQCGHRSRRLAECRTVTGKRLQFHRCHLKAKCRCICMFCQPHFGATASSCLVNSARRQGLRSCATVRLLVLHPGRRRDSL